MRAPGDDVLHEDPRHRREVRRHTPAVGEMLELDGFVGTVGTVTHRVVELTDRRGRARRFELDGQLAWLHEVAVSLVPGTVTATVSAPTVTASGSLAAPGPHVARVARASRIWVEGVHDAELLERVWGTDLREAAIVVEPLGGIDDLKGDVARFGPAPHRRLGVLVDHLIPRSKESRIVAEVRHPDVLVTGHPYVDVWAAVKPALVGLEAWPDIPMGQPWKEGICAALGVSDPPTMWRMLRDRVTTWRDLEQPLVRAVEQLLDHVTDEG
ncbi:MAG: hypothetical protein ACI9OB_000440 [Nonlabens sp.]|jgi:hypothetical protein